VRHPQDDDQTRACLALLESRSPRAFTIVEMVRQLGLRHYDRKRIRAGLEAAVERRHAQRIGKTRYRWTRESERAAARPPAATRSRGGRQRGAATVAGRYVRVAAGYGFVEVLGQTFTRSRRDVLIPRGAEGAAMHGDRVEVEITRRDPHGREVGRVTAVTRAVHEHVVGRLQPGRRWTLVPDGGLLPPVVLTSGVRPTHTDRDRVGLARITAPPTPATWPEGELLRIVGEPDTPEVQFLTIALGAGLRIEFPDEVAAEAERLPGDPTGTDVAARRDLCALPFVTIDGESARDFDDAVCLQKTRRGWRLWVAIADVSHYVRPGSALDREAALRGTSVYFPDRAIPMLPPRLSSELCSLLPERPRLVLVAEMTLDRSGARTATEVYRAVIASHARLTYTQVAAVLSDAHTAGIDDWRTALGVLVPQLRDMRELMLVLFRARVAAGSLDLDLPEALVDLSDEGRTVGVRLSQRNDAHRLIEEFMLEANRAVAGFLAERQVPLPYRVHEPPEPFDVDELNELLAAFGFTLAYDQRVTPPDVQRLLRRLEGHPLARVLARQVLRSLKQAHYTTTNAGHFGLAFETYCHFTSPIRRYPDLLVHRQLGRVLDDEEERARGQTRRLEEASVESSRAERTAMEAERAMLDLRKAEFMLDHLLEPEPGTIVAVLKFGFFVELDAYPIEGLVKLETLADDTYRYVERDRALVGRGGRRRFRIGDRVEVEATNASTARREIDFALVRRLGEANVADAATPARKPRRGGAPKKTSRPKPARPKGATRPATRGKRTR